MRYLTLAVASDAEAERLIQDLLEHPHEPLRTPHWGNAVHATLQLAPAREPVPAAAPAAPTR
jgi:hypothetical protein